MIVLDTFERTLHLDKLVIMRREQDLSLTLRMFVQIFRYSPSDADAVVSACSSAYLIEEHEAAVRDVI